MFYGPVYLQKSECRLSDPWQLSGTYLSLEPGGFYAAFAAHLLDALNLGQDIGDYISLCAWQRNIAKKMPCFAVRHGRSWR